ncbi:MAG TPA: hypothetical protein VK513_09020 [Terriglobales bacterium]|nr:hypothetical protein [Terriglobales bacterium]
MTNWLDDLANKAKDKYQAQRQADEKISNAHKLKVTLGRNFWNDLLAAMTKGASEFDTKFGGSVISAHATGSDSVEVVAEFTKETRNTVDVSYHPDRHAVGWGGKSGNPMGVYMLELIADTHVLAVSGQKKLTAEDLAKEIVTFVVTY